MVLVIQIDFHLKNNQLNMLILLYYYFNLVCFSHAIFFFESHALFSLRSYQNTSDAADDAAKITFAVILLQFNVQPKEE